MSLRLCTISCLCLYPSQPGTYDIQVTALNPVSSDSYQLSITMVTAVVGVAVEEVNNDNRNEKKKTFRISFQDISSDACVTVDYDDGTVDVYGNDELLLQVADRCRRGAWSRHQSYDR